MFEIKDLDLSHVTTLNLTLVESGAFYVDKLYADEKSLSELKKLLNEKSPKAPEEKNPEEKEPCKEMPAATDYSKSPLKNYLAHPEDCNRTLAWLHLHSDYQTDTTMKLQPLRALIVNKVFSTPVPQNVYEAEFGKVTQSVYSRCIGSGVRYNKVGLEILVESYKTFDYEKFLKHI